MPAGHDHGAEGHRHGGRGANRRRLLITLILAASYMVAEVVGGLLTNSLALIADAGHMLSDVAALGLSLFAIRVAERPPTPRRSYGYHRTEILAALVNAATLIAVAVYVVIEAYRRMREPPEVLGALMMWIAVGGLAINLLGLWILRAGRRESLNVRGAWLHVATDALGSVGAIVGGLLIWLFGWYWADPVASVLISILVAYSSWGLLKESVGVLMEGTPAGVDMHEVRAEMLSVEGVSSVHDLHVWSITSGMVALSGHVCMVDGSSQGALLAELRTRLHDRFGIDHMTIQCEPAGFSEGEVHP